MLICNGEYGIMDLQENDYMRKFRRRHICEGVSSKEIMIVLY